MMRVVTSGWRMDVTGDAAKMAQVAMKAAKAEGKTAFAIRKAGKMAANAVFDKVKGKKAMHTALKKLTAKAKLDATETAKQ